MKAVLKSNQSKNAKIIYFNLLCYGGFNKIFPSIETIAKDTNINRKYSVIKAVKELEQNRFINITKKCGIVHHYELATSINIDTPTGYKIVPPTGYNNETTPGTILYPEKEYIKGIYNKLQKTKNINPIVEKTLSILTYEQELDKNFYSVLGELKKRFGEKDFIRVLDSIKQRNIYFGDFDAFKKYLFSSAAKHILKTKEIERIAKFKQSIKTI